MTADECNCPPERDVFREGVGTKPPCPVHDTPERLAEISKMVVKKRRGAAVRIYLNELPRTGDETAHRLAIEAAMACPAGGQHEWRWPEDRRCAKCGGKHQRPT